MVPASSTRTVVRRSQLVVVLALMSAPTVTLTVGCADPSDPPDEVLEPRTVELDTRRTTDPETAVRNFVARIDGLRERVDRFPTDFGVRALLVNTLLARTVFLGSYDDFAEIDVLTRDALDSESADALLLRATYLRAVHRFDEAQELLDQAERVGADAVALESARLVTELARGDDPNMLLPRAEQLAASMSFNALTILASVLAEAGRYIDADDAYLLALSVYRDVSPFTLAHISFVRGVMWGEMANRPDLAEILYRDAVSRLPQFVVANTHLAELEDPAVASERLRPFAEQTETGDPEPAGRLAQRIDPLEAESYWMRAEARYDHLLTLHRDAFLDHASEFFVASGDAELGLQLALENLDNRVTPRAYVVAINAALEHDPARACALVLESEHLRVRHSVLDALATELERSCR